MEAQLETQKTERNESIKLCGLQYDNLCRYRVAFVGRNYPDDCRPYLACNQPEVFLPEYRKKNVEEIPQN